MVIYLVKNLITEKLYVGQTKRSLDQRWLEHCRKKSGCLLLKYAIQKYGSRNFEIKVLEQCSSIEEMNLKEEYYIKSLNTLSPNGYNLVSGGNSREFTEELREKFSLMNTGERNGMFGKKHSEDTKSKIAHKAIGRAATEETRSKMSESKKGSDNSRFGKEISKNQKKVLEHANRLRKKQVLCHQNNVLYESIKDASRDLGLSDTGIANVCNGKFKKLKGLTFEFKESV